MTKGILGIFDGSNSTPDESKHYLCYYCEEEIYFGVTTGPQAKLSYGPGKKTWRHVNTQRFQCSSQATPSTLEVETQTE